MSDSTGTQIQAYLFFGGRCDEALAFYTQAVGAQPGMVMRFSDSPDPMPEGMLKPGFENKVMHSEFRVGDTVVMASDGCGPEESGFKGFSLALTVPNIEDAHRNFNGLAEGGQVTMPLDKTFWSPCYGMLTDKFGVNWMVMVPGAQG